MRNKLATPVIGAALAVTAIVGGGVAAASLAGDSSGTREAQQSAAGQSAVMVPESPAQYFGDVETAMRELVGAEVAAAEPEVTAQTDGLEEIPAADAADAESAFVRLRSTSDPERDWKFFAANPDAGLQAGPSTCPAEFDESLLSCDTSTGPEGETVTTSVLLTKDPSGKEVAGLGRLWGAATPSDLAEAPLDQLRLSRVVRVIRSDGSVTSMTETVEGLSSRTVTENFEVPTNDLEAVAMQDDLALSEVAAP